MKLFANTPPDFWEQLVSKAYWQVFLSVITAFTVAYVTHLFIERRNRNKKLLEAISDFRRYGYELQQAISNRYQCEIFTNVYAALYRITGDKDYHEQHKYEVNKMPDLSFGLSAAYGKVYKTISLIEQLLPEKYIKNARPYLIKVINYRAYNIPDTDKLTKVEEVLAYRDEWTHTLAAMITSHTKENVNKAYEALTTRTSKARSLVRLIIG